MRAQTAITLTANGWRKGWGAKSRPW